MKNKLLIIISFLFLNMGGAYAVNKLLDYFHEENIRKLDTFSDMTDMSLTLDSCSSLLGSFTKLQRRSL